MKKLIMFVMVLAIATPAGALIWEPHAPEFAGCANSGQVVWEFVDDGCDPTTELSVEPFIFDPDLVDPVFGMRYTDGGSVWPWASGVFTVEDAGGGTEDSLNQPIPVSGGKAYMRMYFEVTHTWVENEDASVIGLGLELWNMGNWAGCPDNSEATGEYGGGYEFPEATEVFPLGGGWFQSIWVGDFSEDGSVWTDFGGEGEFEGYDFPDLQDATHTTAIIGMSDFGAEGFDLEEVSINYIWFDDPEGLDIPTEICRCIGCDLTQVLIVDTNDIPIYEPQDIGGPTPMGPIEGQLRVKLSWRPSAGNNNYPPFICTVVIDPDPNDEVAPNPDFTFTKPVPPDPNGNVTLTFTEANYDVFQDVHVKATEDLLKEGNESSNAKFTVTINIADPNFGSDPCQPVTQSKGIIVVDNDIPFIWVGPVGHLEDVLSENNPGVPRCVNVALSHKPTHDVEVRAELASEFELIFDVVVMDPNFEPWTDPNHLLFDPCDYDVTQTICLTVIDDEDYPDADSEWIPGQILLNGASDDLRYEAESEDGDGELEETAIDFNVQDNDCGAWGYDALDQNQDCIIDLSEAAALYGQWLFCTLPYDGQDEYPTPDPECDKSWNLVEEEE